MQKKKKKVRIDKSSTEYNPSQKEKEKKHQGLRSQEPGDIYFLIIFNETQEAFKKRDFVSLSLNN